MNTSKNTKGLKALIEVISELNKIIELLSEANQGLKKENNHLKLELKKI